MGIDLESVGWDVRCRLDYDMRPIVFGAPIPRIGGD